MAPQCLHLGHNPVLQRFHRKRSPNAHSLRHLPRVMDSLRRDVRHLHQLATERVSALTCPPGRYAALCLSDPGRVLRDDADSEQEMLPLGEDVEGAVRCDSEQCATCGAQAPLRSHHCHVCRCCVRAFDHHCFWIGTCIGEKNHALFAAYLWVQTVVLLMALMFVGDALQRATGAALHAAQVAVVLCLLGALVMVGGLAVFHAYLLRTGQTTREVHPHVICA